MEPKPAACIRGREIFQCTGLAAWYCALLPPYQPLSALEHGIGTFPRLLIFAWLAEVGCFPSLLNLAAALISVVVLLPWAVMQVMLAKSPWMAAGAEGSRAVLADPWSLHLSQSGFLGAVYYLQE